MQEQRIKYLFQLHLSKACTLAEREELAALALEEQHALLIKELISNAWNVTGEEHDLSTEKANELFTRIIAQSEEAAGPESLVVSIKPRIQLWKRIAVAASILITIGIAAYVILSGVEGQHKKELSVVEVPADIPAPDKNRAQIKLADGRIIYLDSAANGELVNTNGITVTKTADGKIIYTPSADPERSRTETPTAVQYNTMTNPRGSIVQNMTLADGSKVWLNAGSSITYPVAFIGNERKVNITGEAYFEIAKHDLPPALAGGKQGVRMPFIVEANGTSTKVLGTHFNINAYDDEQETKITLVEGSVNVLPRASARGEGVILKPGEQAVLTHDSRLTTNGSPDIDQVLSWKNGFFDFKKADIKTVMRELARWYNVDVVYQGTINETFYLKARRGASVADIFKILETGGAVKLKVEGRKIIVTP